MRQTWRWFGPDDPITPRHMAQAGVEGVVTALYHLPPGTVWSGEDIARRQQATAADAGLKWEVVESLPVSEAIKTKAPERDDHVAAYKQSLRNLAGAGLEVICYNFMPVLDWTRTELRSPMPHGGTAMRFDLAEFAAFDLYLLARPGAEDDYTEELRETARGVFDAMDDTARTALTRNITAGLPGTIESWSLEQVRAQLATYDGIDAATLRQNLVDFLADVVPLAEELGLRLCCHPDDPPFPLLGLPRIMSTLAEYRQVIEAVDSPANGATFCTGSLGVREDFDGPEFVRTLGPRIHFVHLRNTTRDGPSAQGRFSFYEAEHLAGDTDMVATIAALLDEEARRRSEGRVDADIPMRPDHGQDILDDLGRDGFPGYPLIGRTRGLAELRGVMAGLAGTAKS